MVDQGKSNFCVVFTMSLCALELKQPLISLFFLHHAAWKLRIHALRNCLTLICEHELQILPIKNLGPQNSVKDHGENYMKVKPHQVHDL